jgi:Ca2+:H+ antiporter
VPTLLPPGRGMRPLSLGISAVLVAMYLLSLLFSLRTHREQMHALAEEEEEVSRTRALRQDPVWMELARLALGAAATAVASEILVGSLSGALVSLRLPETFAGVIVVAIVGNAAEHSTAILFARRGEMDVSLGIAWESSKQIALFVAPLLVFAGAFFGVPMDLAFNRFEVAAVGLAVLALALIAMDGETHWLEGAFLLAVYAVLGMGFFFV